MHAFTLFKHQIECNQVQKLIGRLQKHTELFVTADISNKAKACRLKVMPLEDFMSLMHCNAGVHASVLTAPCSLSSTQVSAHVHACLTLWMTVLLCTCCKHQVCLVQDTQSSSQAPAVPMLKPRESPLRWSNTNPQVSPTFVHTAQL